METWEELRRMRYFMETTSRAYMKHEKRESATIGVPSSNYMMYPIEGRKFFSVETNVFKGLIEGFYRAAQLKYPEQFGTGNAHDVLDALLKIHPVLDFDLNRYREFLQYEQFSHLVELAEGEPSSKILRLDLFRKVEPHKKTGIPEFTGGLMHALKHFSINGINLSTGNDVQNILSPGEVIPLIIRAFFFEELTIKKSKAFSKIKINEKYNLKFVFYLEENTNIYFITTIHKELN